MSRLVPMLCFVAAAGVLATSWRLLMADDLALALPTGKTVEPPPATDTARGELLAARRTCDLTALDRFIASRTEAVATGAATDRTAWRVLAEAHLERAQLRSMRCGLRVGEPVHSTLPPELADDVDRGLAAVARARSLGDDCGDLFRIEAALLSQRITGLGAALQWNGKVQAALREATARAPDSPELHVAVGLRKLLAPKAFGHDPVAALTHFEFAAAQLPHDERPATFAAMACALQQKREQALAWLQQAVARNPANVFAAVVLRRVRAGEADAFARDVSDAEAAAARLGK